MIPHAIIIVLCATVAFPFAWIATGWQTRKPVHDRRDVFAEGAGAVFIADAHGAGFIFGCVNQDHNGRDTHAG